MGVNRACRGVMNRTSGGRQSPNSFFYLDKEEMTRWLGRSNLLLNHAQLATDLKAGKRGIKADGDNDVLLEERGSRASGRERV